MQISHLYSYFLQIYSFKTLLCKRKLPWVLKMLQISLHKRHLYNIITAVWVDSLHILQKKKKSNTETKRTNKIKLNLYTGITRRQKMAQSQIMWKFSSKYEKVVETFHNHIKESGYYCGENKRKEPEMMKHRSITQ